METLKETECRSICPIANALDVVGDRWTLLVLRDLMFMGKHEYREFLNSPEGIATNILADRLKRLLKTGLMNQIPYPEHKSKKLYYLTQKGKDLLPVLVEMIIWGGTYRASQEMPREKFNQVKNNPKKFMRDALKAMQKWEEKYAK